jgi:hypothetical protein
MDERRAEPISGGSRDDLARSRNRGPRTAESANRIAFLCWPQITRSWPDATVSGFARGATCPTLVLRWGCELQLSGNWIWCATIVGILKREADGSRVTKLDLSLAICGNSHGV